MNLIEHLMAELKVERHQAEGGAGLLLALAQRELTHGEFLLVADSIPAISDIIGKAPRVGLAECSHWRVMVSRWLGGLGGMTCVAPGFESLGMDAGMVSRFADVIAAYFGSRGGPVVESLMRSAWR